MKEAIAPLSQKVHLQVFSDGLAAKDTIFSFTAGSQTTPIDFILRTLILPKLLVLSYCVY